MVFSLLQGADAVSCSCGTINWSSIRRRVLIAAFQKACSLQDEPPPGRSVYEQDDIAIYEVDGEEHKVCT